MKAPASVALPAAAASLEMWMLVLLGVGAGVFNALNAGAAAWIRYHNDAFVPAWGATGIIANSLPSSLLPAALMSVLGSFAARRHLPERLFPPPPQRSWIRRLPERLIARATLFTACTTLVFVAATYLAVTLTNITSLSFGAMMVTQLIQAMLMGLILGPIIVARVLSEPRYA